MKVFPFSLPGVVYLGTDSLAKLSVEVEKMGVKKIFLITDKGLMNAGVSQKVGDCLAGNGVEITVYSEAEREPSVENVEKAAHELKKGAYDLVIGLGGGSPLDVAKGSAVLANNEGSILDYVGVDLIPKPGLPLVLIPTTAGTGAEVTKNAIFTDVKAQLKKGIVSEYLLPRVAIVDPKLTVSVPAKITAATGMDALTHAIESYTSPKATIQTDLYALEAIKLISGNLRRVVSDGSDLEAREKMAAGSMFAGISLANAGVGAVHALAYPLGGQFGISHGLANALLLPYVMEFNIIGDLEKFKNVAAAMGQVVKGKCVREAAFMALTAVQELSKDIGIPQSLKEVEVPKEALEELSLAAVDVKRLLNNNPRQVELDDIRRIYQAAY